MTTEGFELPAGHGSAAEDRRPPEIQPTRAPPLRHAGRRHRAGDHWRRRSRVLRAADRRIGARARVRRGARSGWRALKAHGTTFPDGVVRGREGRRRRDPRAGLAQRLSAGATRAASIRPARCASGSICSPTSARRNARGLSAALRQAGRSRDRAREHRRLLRRPQHVPWAPASSCRRRTSRSRCARSRAHGSTRIAEAAFELAMQRPQARHRRAQGERAARLRRAVPRMRARGRGALSAGRATRRRSSTRWRRCWCATPARST